jgi:aldose sugar dehydrogenase
MLRYDSLSNFRTETIAMNKSIIVLISSFILTAGSFCTQAQPGSTAVETKQANTKYKPAFAGQTRIGAVVTKTPYEGRVLTSSLIRPWGIAALPDGRFLITEIEGNMRIVTGAGNIGEPITGIPKVYASGQGGLLGLCLDPAFATNRMVYWAFSESLDGESLTSVAKGMLSADEKSFQNVSVIYRAKPAYKGGLHFGGRVLIGKDGNLYLSTGERSDKATRPQAQDLNSGLGKIIRITKDGQPAAGNPFAGTANARPEIYSYGHRNVQGITFHPETGDLWEVEFGPRGGDELNRIVAGKNYGWPTITYGIEYSGAKIGDAIQQKDGLEQPVYYWDPVISPSGITFYSGKQIPEWKNNLFISSLSGMHVCRLVIQDNKVVGEERLLSEREPALQGCYRRTRWRAVRRDRWGKTVQHQEEIMKALPSPPIS